MSFLSTPSTFYIHSLSAGTLSGFKVNCVLINDEVHVCGFKPIFPNQINIQLFIAADSISRLLFIFDNILHSNIAIFSLLANNISLRYILISSIIVIIGFCLGPTITPLKVSHILLNIISYIVGVWNLDLLQHLDGIWIRYLSNRNSKTDIFINHV